MVSFTPRYARSAPAPAIQRPPTSPPTTIIPTLIDIGECRCVATAAAPSPPSTIAPSPPSTTRPRRSGSAVASAVNISGAARCSVFWNENQVPNEPRNISPYTASGLRPVTAMNTPNSSSAAAIAAPGTAIDSIARRIAARRASAASPAAVSGARAPDDVASPAGSATGEAPMLTPTPIAGGLVSLPDDAFDQVVHL